ncbi:NAD(P)/FAD-dependent oxidoreductase, partial [Streptomyces boncukensis]
MRERIVVLGAGYAGLAAARGIAERTHPGSAEVVLVNARDTFTERVRLHQVASGQHVRQRPIAELLGGAPVRFVAARVTGIDAERREVRLAPADGAAADGAAADGAAADGSLPYDTLVYALGSRADPGAVPGAAEHAYPVATAEDADRLRDRLAGLAAGDAVAVVGGGLTGIETATELAETRPELTVRLLTSGPFGAAFSARGRAHLRRSFDRLGIEVRDGVRVTAVSPDGAVLEG